MRYRRALSMHVFMISCMMMVLTATASAAIIADHISADRFDAIPMSVVEHIDTAYNIFYIHTSHGSQIMTGISLVQSENAAYDPPYFSEYGDDLGHTGDTSWAPPTRTYLNTHPDCNMAMFSWCGGCSDNTEEGINIYLAKMEELETDYPDITFIYMTGHLDGSGPTGDLYRNNNQIRDYCVAHDKIMFDFADIESYDPDGTYYPDESDYCNWCYDWCAVVTCPDCSCAHSQCFNCYRKGRAWWWMMARISGWSEVESPCGDANGDMALNLGDAVHMVNYIFKGGSAPQPLCIADANGDGNTDVGDAVFLISYVFKGGPAPEENCCP